MADEWNVAVPIDHLLIGSIPGAIRALKASTKSQLDHEHETPVDGDATGSEHSAGSAVCYEDTSTPTTRPGGATLGANAIDQGRLWLDDNFDPPILKRWDGSAFEIVGTLAGGASPNQAFLISTTAEDIEGGRESQIRFKGTQSGGELTTLGYIEFAHDSGNDDEFGRFRVVLNNGGEGDSPTSIAIDYARDGTIDIASSVSVLDEDDMSSDSAVKVATQQSIKAYVDSAPNYTPSSLSFSDNPAEQSITFPNGLIFKAGYVVKAGDPTTITFGTAFPNAVLSASITQVHTVTVTHNTSVRSMTTASLIVNDSDQNGTGYYWQAWGR